MELQWRSVDDLRWTCEMTHFSKSSIIKLTAIKIKILNKPLEIGEITADWAALEADHQVEIALFGQ